MEVVHVFASRSFCEDKIAIFFFLFFCEALIFRSSHRTCSIKKGVLRNFAKFTGKYLCQSLFFKKVRKETLAQLFFCKFCKTFKNTIFTEHLWTATLQTYKAFLSQKLLLNFHSRIKFCENSKIWQNSHKDFYSRKFVILK